MTDKPAYYHEFNFHNNGRVLCFTVKRRDDAEAPAVAHFFADTPVEGEDKKAARQASTLANFLSGIVIRPVEEDADLVFEIEDNGRLILAELTVGGLIDLTTGHKTSNRLCEALLDYLEA